MRVLIRFVRRGPAGAVEQKDKLYEGEVLTLGRATDQVVQLKDRRVALAHAQIVLRSGLPVLISRVPGGVLVNGRLEREARLSPGDTVNLGANVLRILNADSGCDLAFTFELDAEARSDELVPDLPRLRLSDLGLAKRRWSWALFLGILLLTLIIPAAGLQYPSFQSALRNSVLPDDHLWSPGALSPQHESLSARCDACHGKPFLRVRNDACLTCHDANLHGHLGAEAVAEGVVLTAARGRGALDEVRCASCHGEHHEPSTLVRNDPAVCTACHQDLMALAPGSRVTPTVTDFAQDHPAFRLPRLGSSGLKFPHKQHLAKAGVRSPTGDTVLGCRDCHSPEPGGARFRPLQMERDCGSCHLLDFDPADPDRTVPHGDARAVVEFLVDYYSRRYLENFADPLAKPGAARRPAPRLSAAERARLLGSARQEAEVVSRDLFERRSCSQCHEITRVATGPDSWKVQPVELPTAWFSSATFSHASHGTTLTPCVTCHEASSRSEVAQDVLLPGIGTCRNCHAGGERRATPRDRVTSTCTLCHGFHIDLNPLWHAKASGT